MRGTIGIILVQDDLVVVLVDDLFDHAVIDQDLGYRVGLPLHPDLDLPAVPVKIGAFAFIMEQAVAGVDLHLLIDPDFHCSLLGSGGYNVIMSEDQ